MACCQGRSFFGRVLILPSGLTPSAPPSPFVAGRELTPSPDFEVRTSSFFPSTGICTACGRKKPSGVTSLPFGVLTFRVCCSARLSFVDVHSDSRRDGTDGSGSDANTIPDDANLWSFDKSGEGYNGFVFGFLDCEFQFQIQQEGQDVLVRVHTAGQVDGDVERDMGVTPTVFARRFEQFLKPVQRQPLAVHDFVIKCALRAGSLRHGTVFW